MGRKQHNEYIQDAAGGKCKDREREGGRKGGRKKRKEAALRNPLQNQTY
jgi:hypothetical protein